MSGSSQQTDEGVATGTGEDSHVLPSVEAAPVLDHVHETSPLVQSSAPLATYPEDEFELNHDYGLSDLTNMFAGITHWSSSGTDPYMPEPYPLAGDELYYHAENTGGVPGEGTLDDPDGLMPYGYLDWEAATAGEEYHHPSADETALLEEDLYPVYPPETESEGDDYTYVDEDYLSDHTSESLTDTDDGLEHGALASTSSGGAVGRILFQALEGLEHLFPLDNNFVRSMVQFVLRLETEPCTIPGLTHTRICRDPKLAELVSHLPPLPEFLYFHSRLQSVWLAGIIVVKAVLDVYEIYYRTQGPLDSYYTKVLLPSYERFYSSLTASEVTCMTIQFRSWLLDAKTHSQSSTGHDNLFPLCLSAKEYLQTFRERSRRLCNVSEGIGIEKLVR